MSFVGSGKLQVKPLTAKLTRDTETFGKMDPYCKVWLENEIKKTKTHQDGGKYPSWNDTFTFQRNLECLLYLEVWDEDTISADDLIGETTISLSDTFEKKKTQIWYTISYKGKDAGKVLISLEFIPDPVEKRPQAPAPYSSAPTIPMMPGMAMHLGYNLPQMYMQGSQAPPVYPIPPYPPNPYYAPSPPSYPPPSSQNNFQGLQRNPTVTPGSYPYPPYGGYPPQGQGYGQGGQGYPQQGSYGGPIPPQNYNQGDYSGGGKFPPQNQGPYPPSNQGIYPNQGAGGAYPQNNQGAPYPNNPYPNNNQGGSYSQNNQGAPYSQNNQAGQYPPNNQAGAYPPNNQAGPYPPPSNQGASPYSGANQGGPYPQTFQGAPVPSNNQAGASNNQVAPNPNVPNNQGNNQNTQEGSSPAQVNNFNQFGQGQEGRQQNIPKAEARIEEGYPNESVVLQNNNGQGFGGN